MLLSTFDSVPETGEYLAYAADGTHVGSLYMEKGGILPPGTSGLGYFELIKPATEPAPGN